MDAYARDHDRAYDKARVAGFSGVVFSTKTVGADYTLVGNAFDITFNPYGISSPTQRLEGFAVGTFIGLFALPKTVVYGVGQAAKSLPANQFPGL